MRGSEDSRLSPQWEKLKVVSVMLATVLIPLVLALVSQWYTAALKENEIGVKYVELSLSILKAPPGQQTPNLRKWAIAVVNHHSQVPLSEEALTELQTQDLSNLLKALHERSMTPIRNLR